MKKLLTILALFVVLSFAAQAQEVKESPLTVGKQQRSGFVGNYKQSKTLTQAAFDEKMKNAGLKRTTRKNGYAVYRQVSWTALGPSTLDLYVKISGGKKQSAVAFIASKGYDNDVTTANDPVVAENVRNMLVGFDQDIAAYALKLQIAKEEEQARKLAEQHAKAQKKLEDSRKRKREKEKELLDLKGQI